MPCVWAADGILLNLIPTTTSPIFSQRQGVNDGTVDGKGPLRSLRGPKQQPLQSGNADGLVMQSVSFRFRSVMSQA